jgi:rhodanese-related sulfurtransferase
MKMKHINKLLIIMSILSFIGCIFGCKAQNVKYPSLSVEAFEKCIADSSVIRLDVRTAGEFAEGHIEKALNIDVLQSNFKSKALNLLPKNKKIAVYCRSGRRSKKAANILTNCGFTVIDLNNGYIGWTNAGKAITK